ncbi:MAG: SPOR domain-containing protein [Brevundimonas sp.]|uniref:SPOR domain-containing protein n=1 Tax=Brevundimonas sp. TaxID=1871086 RepID=UPI0025BEF768|nr:SPOR domain-containing protein [Brevundimonas sp.]MBX3476103.1 SPOR domain-containing protein [Brevundimonas sp.]
MNPWSLSRPVLACLSVLALGACNGGEGDPNRFENLAQAVAAIDVPMTPVSHDAPSTPVVVATTPTGLRPALQVQVMDPHDLWDARDGTIQGAVRQAVVRTAAEAAPAMARSASQAVVRQVSDTTTLRPALSAASGPATVIQLGAFSSEAAARAAWAEAGKGGALAGLTPRFEPVEVNGRRLTRLKVGPIPAEAAAGLCRAARVSDPWCRRAG